MILGDYHTHTKNSDGKATVEESLEAADKAGLLEVGISDHGLRHMARGMKFRDIARTRKEIESLQQKFKVKCLLSIEANIFSSYGDIDVKPQQMDLFDYIVAGYHKAAFARDPIDAFRFTLPALFTNLRNYTDRQRRKYTSVIVKAIKSNKINILAHLNYGIPCFVREVAKAAIDYNTYIELNGKHISALMLDEVAELNALGVKFLLNSDAHSPDRVGEISKPLAVVEAVGISKDRIFNWDKLPTDLKIKK